MRIPKEDDFLKSVEGRKPLREVAEAIAGNSFAEAYIEAFKVRFGPAADIKLSNSERHMLGEFSRLVGFDRGVKLLAQFFSMKTDWFIKTGYSPKTFTHSYHEINLALIERENRHSDNRNFSLRCPVETYVYFLFNSLKNQEARRLIKIAPDCLAVGTKDGPQLLQTDVEAALKHFKKLKANGWEHEHSLGEIDEYFEQLLEVIAANPPPTDDKEIV